MGRGTAIPPMMRSAIVRMSRVCALSVKQISYYTNVPLASVYFVLKTWSGEEDAKEGQLKIRGRRRLLDYDDTRVSGV